MQKSAFDICLEEIVKPSNERNIELMSRYIETLSNYTSLFKVELSKNPNYISYTCKIMKYKETEPNELILQQGDKGDTFYLILKGKVSIIILKNKTYELTEEQFICYLLECKKYNQNEIIRQCINLNTQSFSLDDSFENLFKGLVNKKTKGDVYLDNNIILEKANEVNKYIKEHPIQDKIIITPDEYINRVKLNISKKKEQDKEMLHKKKNKKIKTVTIPYYEIVNYFETGQTFGEVALNSPNAKRTATIISSEKCYLAVIQSKDYDELLKEAVETSKKIFFNLIYSYKIFNTISKYVFTKRYYQFFIYKKCEKDTYLIEENKKCENVFFIFNGEFEITLTGNMVDVNNLIIFYKKLIKKIRKDVNDKFLEYKEEEKENDDLILNKNFKTTEENKILLEKKKIKLGIFDNRQIMGLRDICDLSNLNYIKGLLSCQNLSYNAEVYYINRKIFNEMYDYENGVDVNIEDLEIKKINIFIQKLNEYKYHIYGKINKKNKEISDRLIIENKKIKKYNKKNRLYSLENNSLIEEKKLNNLLKKNFLYSSINIDTNNNKIKKKKKQINLPYLSINNKQEKKEENNFIKKNQKDLFLQRFKKEIFQRNYFDNALHSYISNKNNSNLSNQNQQNNYSKTMCYKKEELNKEKYCQKNNPKLNFKYINKYDNPFQNSKEAGIIELNLIEKIKKKIDLNYFLIFKNKK